jgi:hypothetical protein
VGLDWSGPQAATDPLELLAHPDHCGVRVNVVPAETQHLASAHPVDEQEDKPTIADIGI